MASSETFDCFLSHNSRDKIAVRALATALHAHNLRVWLDDQQLRPGLPWQPLLESGIRASRSVAVLVGADGLGPWEEAEMNAALLLAINNKLPVIPVLLASAPAIPELPLFLSTFTWVDLRCSMDPDGSSGLEKLVWGITGKRADQPCPSLPPEQVTSAPVPLLSCGERQMIDPIGLLGSALSGIGVLQGVRTNKTLDERLRLLSEGIDKIGNFHAALDLAKDLHNQFQMIEIVGLEPLTNALERDRDNLSKTAANVKYALSRFRAFPLSEMSAARSRLEIDGGAVPPNVQNDVFALPKLADEMEQAIIQYKQDVEKIGSLLDKRNFGNEFDLCISHMASSVKRGQVSANQFILRSIPIMGFLHFELKCTVGYIA